MSREELLWQIRWLIHFYMTDRLWFSIASPLWAARERALQTGDWTEYRAMYDEAQA